MSQSVSIASILRDPALYTLVQDQIEEATLKISAWEQLKALAHRETVLENYLWEKDSDDVLMFCHRG
ncbi:unnamed protein product [Peniophora sp. CBMAI 1063]|nr:unnamed protein product [Peniophora sp. CBMAI 1063]